MKFDITESITANLNLKEIEAWIRETAKKDGYDVVKITPQYDYQKQYGFHSQRDVFPTTATTSSSRDFAGFKIDLKRMKDNDGLHFKSKQSS